MSDERMRERERVATLERGHWRELLADARRVGRWPVAQVPAWMGHPEREQLGIIEREVREQRGQPAAVDLDALHAVALYLPGAHRELADQRRRPAIHRWPTGWSIHGGPATPDRGASAPAVALWASSAERAYQGPKKLVARTLMVVDGQGRALAMELPVERRGPKRAWTPELCAATDHLGRHFRVTGGLPDPMVCCWVGAFGRFCWRALEWMLEVVFDGAAGRAPWEEPRASISLIEARRR